MSLQDIMNPKPPTPDVQKFDDVLKEQKVPLRSWRKKYRKMKLKFDKAMDESNKLFTDCHKLDALAKRLQEENDLFLESLLHYNEASRAPDYDLGDPHEDVSAVPSASAVPALDPDVPRSLAALLNVPHTRLGEDTSKYPEDITGDSPPSYLTTSYEEEYITNLDAQIAASEPLDEGWRPMQLPRSRILPSEKELHNANPVSVLSWLRKYHPETFIQEKEAATETTKKRGGGGGGGGGKRSSMATVTSAANTGTPAPKAEEEEVEPEWPAAVAVDEKLGSARGKKSREDEPYRPKGGSSRPSKRKRDDGEKPGRGKRAKAAASTPG